MNDDVESCRSLLIVQDEVVLLLHQSAKDFLIGSGADHFVNVFEAHATFAYSCVDHIIQDFHSNRSPHSENSDDTFSTYSFKHWTDHAQMAESEFKVKASQAEFFDIYSDSRQYWLRKSFVRGYWRRKRLSVFHVAAYFGIPILVDFGLKKSSRTMT